MGCGVAPITFHQMMQTKKNPTGVIRRDQNARSKPPATKMRAAVLSFADSVRLPHPLAHRAHVEGLLQLRTSLPVLPRLSYSLPGVRRALFLHRKQQAVEQPHRLLPINGGRSAHESFLQGWRRKAWS